MRNLLQTDDVERQPQSLDRMLHAAIGQATCSVSPASLTLAYLDWLIHFHNSPAKWGSIARQGLPEVVAIWPVCGSIGDQQGNHALH